MTKGVFIQLESTRLAQYSEQVRCYICDGGNLQDAELCRHCFAPMALAHQVAVQNVAPQIIATLGPSGVGKTVYLGMLLDMLSRQPQRLQVLARGAFSITLQQTTMAAMARCEFPQKTPNEPDRWNWVHCQVRKPKQRRPTELILPDLAGEAMAEEVDHPRTYGVIAPLLAKSSGVMMLVDAYRLQEGTPDLDYFSLKLLSYLSQVDDGAKGSWPHRPLAVIFSKSDQCDECFADPEAYARRHTPRLWEHCNRFFSRHRFFSSGVAGACAYRCAHGQSRRVPLRVEPRDIIEPFEWLINEINTS